MPDSEDVNRLPHNKDEKLWFYNESKDSMVGSEGVNCSLNNKPMKENFCSRLNDSVLSIDDTKPEDRNIVPNKGGFVPIESVYTMNYTKALDSVPNSEVFDFIINRKPALSHEEFIFTDEAPYILIESETLEDLFSRKVDNSSEGNTRQKLIEQIFNTQEIWEDESNIENTFKAICEEDTSSLFPVDVPTGVLRLNFPKDLLNDSFRLPLLDNFSCLMSDCKGFDIKPINDMIFLPVNSLGLYFLFPKAFPLHEGKQFVLRKIKNGREMVDSSEKASQSEFIIVCNGQDMQKSLRYGTCKLIVSEDPEEHIDETLINEYETLLRPEDQKSYENFPVDLKSDFHVIFKALKNNITEISCTYEKNLVKFKRLKMEIKQIIQKLDDSKIKSKAAAENPNSNWKFHSFEGFAIAGSTEYPSSSP